ncbi:MAG: PilZ domain-containing protein [Termitinemataceae bacterium]|nr:MAG: PilZ domain-containing protein [Termitinemataceae bacterium]
MQFKSIPVTFTKEIIQVTGLQAKQISIKCASDFFPCVVYSTSFEEAKLVANIKSGVIEKLKETNNSASIKFSFILPASSERVAFLVPVRVVGHAPYNNSSDMSTITMQFAQRPPDDLIEIVGRVIEANLNAAKRKDEIIQINAESLRKLKYAGKEVGITVQGVPRRCILRDISFSGARVIVLGISKMLINKPGSIKFEFTDPAESYEINGTFIGGDAVTDRKDMVVLDLRYDEQHLPMTYKVRLNEYLTTIRKLPQAAQSTAAAAHETASAVLPTAPNAAVPPLTPASSASDPPASKPAVT